MFTYTEELAFEYSISTKLSEKYIFTIHLEKLRFEFIKFVPYFGVNRLWFVVSMILEPANYLKRKSNVERNCYRFIHIQKPEGLRISTRLVCN